MPGENSFFPTTTSTSSARKIHRTNGGMQLLEGVIKPLSDGKNIDGTDLLIPAFISLTYLLATGRPGATPLERFTTFILGGLMGASFVLKLLVYLEHKNPNQNHEQVVDAEFVVKIIFTALYLVFTGIAEVNKEEKPGNEAPAGAPGV